MKKTILKKYAKAVVKIGINLKKGQDVYIFIDSKQSEFAEILTEECYKKGARKVNIEWKNDSIEKLHVTYQSYETLSKVSPWQEAKEEEKTKILPCAIHVDSSNPNYLDGVDMNKVSRAYQERRKVLKKYRDLQDNKIQWVIVALPSIEWAKVVFPNEKDKIAYKKLEEAIIKCTRIDGKNPIKDWEKHIETLQIKANLMNQYHFDYLEYQSSNGTNLKLKLNPNHVWLSAREETLKKRGFTANMPTEEVFTMPDREGVDGVVVSTKPLSHQGRLIENFKIYFEKGRVTKVEAEKGLEDLQKIVNTDEGSHHLGEVALVPYNSPINQTNILFYNTLFDENACCHLALGAGFSNNLKEFEKYSMEELKQMGLNDSLTHVDFMIGSEDLSIIGTTKDSEKVTIFKNGVWNI